MALTSPKSTVDAAGRRHPVPDSGVEPETIMQIQVVRDGHDHVGGRYPANTVERVALGPSRNSKLGTFVLGEVWRASGRSDDLFLKNTGQVRFAGAQNIVKKRFRRLVDSQDVPSVGAASEARTEAPTEVSDWVLYVAGEEDARNIQGRLMKAGDVSVLQVVGSLPMYKSDSIIVLCPANVEDPESAMTTGSVVACVPSKTSSNLIFKVVAQP